MSQVNFSQPKMMLGPAQHGVDKRSIPDTFPGPSLVEIRVSENALARDAASRCGTLNFTPFLTSLGASFSHVPL